MIQHPNSPVRSAIGWHRTGACCAADTVAQPATRSAPPRHRISSLRQLNHASYARISIIRAPDLLEMRKRRLARTVARGELLDVPGIVERCCHPGDLIVRRGGPVGTAPDPMDVGGGASSG